MRVELSPEEYELCDSESSDYWCNEKPGVYGKGLCRTKDDLYRPARTGMLGEMAFSKVFGLECDFSYRRGGVDTDFRLNGYSFDIKCSRSEKTGAGLIRCVNENGVFISPKCQYYVFSFIEDESRKNKFASVVFVGYIDRRKFSKKDIRPARRRESKHMNYDIPYGDERIVGMNLLLDWWNKSKKENLIEYGRSYRQF